MNNISIMTVEKIVYGKLSYNDIKRSGYREVPSNFKLIFKCKLFYVYHNLHEGIYLIDLFHNRIFECDSLVVNEPDYSF